MEQGGAMQMALVMMQMALVTKGTRV